MLQGQSALVATLEGAEYARAGSDFGPYATRLSLDPSETGLRPGLSARESGSDLHRSDDPSLKPCHAEILALPRARDIMGNQMSIPCRTSGRSWMPEEERLDQEEAIKVRRPTWKRPAVIASIATPVIIAVFFAVLAAVLETPRLDASSEASLETSLQRMTSGMSDAQKKEFHADCMDLTLPDMMKSAFQYAFLSNRPPASDGPRMFRPLQGMNAMEIHRKAEEARRARTLADDSADAQSPQPLPGVPPPVGALSQPSGSQSNIQSPPKGEPD
jgi:hypothetical protein